VPRVRVRGFVPASAIIAGDKLDYHTFGHGRGFGSSEQRIAVPGGACLYDGASGEVIGVNLAPEDATRAAATRRAGGRCSWTRRGARDGVRARHVVDRRSEGVVLESCNATTKK